MESGVGGGIVGASTSPVCSPGRTWGSGQVMIIFLPCSSTFAFMRYTVWQPSSTSKLFFRSANATFCDIGIVVSVMMVLVAIIRGNAGVVCGGFGVSKVK